MDNQEFVEVWKDVPGYEGIYLVSNFGNVCSLKRGKRTQLKKPVQFSRGKLYPSVCLLKDGKQKRVYVHRLVALAFIENPNLYNEVDHINGDESFNHVSNLRWCTHTQNMGNIHKKKISGIIRIDPNTGDRKEYKFLKDVSEDGFIPTMVCRVCRGKKKTHHKYRWAYKQEL